MGGFNLERSQSQGELTGKLELFHVLAAHSTLLAIGDAVLMEGSSNAVDGVQNIDTIDSTATTGVSGIIAGFEPQFAGENLSTTGLAAGIAGKARVLIDPSLLFTVAVNGTELTNDQVGLNISSNAAVATKSGGLTLSNMEVTSSTAAATITLKFRIVAIAKNPSTGLFDGSYALVRMNNTEIAPNTVGA